MTEDIAGTCSRTTLDSSRVNTLLCKAENNGGNNEGMEKDDNGPPPDGGTTAWVQVAPTHLVFCNTWGVTNLDIPGHQILAHITFTSNIP